MDLNNWPTETETAEKLSVDVRSVQRYAKRGLIEMRKRPREGKKAENVCNPRDVEKLMPTAHVMPEETETAAAATSATTALTRRPKYDGGPDAAGEFMAFLRAITMALHSETNTEASPWLSIEEAAKWTGFTTTFLRAQIKAKKIHALRGGPHGSTRVQRASLEAFAG